MTQTVKTTQMKICGSSWGRGDGSGHYWDMTPLSIGQKKAMLGLAAVIVKRTDTAKGLENLLRNALAFLKLASIRLMPRKLFSN